MNQLDRIERNRKIYTLLLTAKRYVEGYAENKNNHPQARDGARDLIRQINEISE